MMLLRFMKPYSLAACLYVVSALVFSEGTARAQTPDAVAFQDLWQTVQARKLLLDDPQLGSLNLGVKVSYRAAVLWGPVPSAELAFRAEQRLRTMFELVEVRNCLTIQPDDNAPPNEPAAPTLLPEGTPAGTPNIQRRPAFLPNNRGELAGFVPPEQVISARSSPREQVTNPPAPAGPSVLRLPFLGSVAVPR